MVDVGLPIPSADPGAVFRAGWMSCEVTAAVKARDAQVAAATRTVAASAATAATTVMSNEPTGALHNHHASLSLPPEILCRKEDREWNAVVRRGKQVVAAVDSSGLVEQAAEALVAFFSGVEAPQEASPAHSFVAEPQKAAYGTS
jgi:hypothetical protein